MGEGGGGVWVGVYPLHNFSPEVGGGRLHGNGRLQGTLQYYPVQVRPKHDNQTLNDSVSVSDSPESWPERRRLSWPPASQLPSGLPAWRWWCCHYNYYYPVQVRPKHDNQMLNDSMTHLSCRLRDSVWACRLHLSCGVVSLHDDDDIVVSVQLQLLLRVSERTSLHCCCLHWLLKRVVLHGNNL